MHGLKSGSTFQDFKGPKVYNVQNSCGEVPSFFQSPLLLCCSWCPYKIPINIIDIYLIAFCSFLFPLCSICDFPLITSANFLGSLQVQVTKIYTNNWEVQISFKKAPNLNILGFPSGTQHHPPIQPLLWGPRPSDGRFLCTALLGSTRRKCRSAGRWPFLAAPKRPPGPPAL